jgi:phosphoglycolate phosphatase
VRGLVPIRCVATDIDGTLTDYQQRLDWSAVKALRAVEANGIPVILASGTIGPVARSLSHFLGCTGPIVAENGGLVMSHDGKTKKVLAKRDLGDKAVRHLRRHGLKPEYLWSDPWRISEVALDLAIDEARVKELLADWPLRVVGTKFALHLFTPNIDKGRGIKQALKLLPNRIDAKDVLAIGDSNNDEPMLRACGHRAVVGNATVAARSVAHYVAKKAHGAGVAEIVRKYGLA